MAVAFDAQLGANPTGAGNVTGTAVTLSTANAVAAGGTIVVFASIFGPATLPTLTVSGGGLTWTTVSASGFTASAYTIRAAVAQAPAGLAAGTTLTATFSVTGTELYIWGASLTGSSGNLCGTASNTQGPSITAWTGGAVTMTADGAVIGGCVSNSGGASATPTSPWLEFPTPAGDWVNTNGGIQTETVYRLDGTNGNAFTPGGTFNVAGATVAVSFGLEVGAAAAPAVMGRTFQAIPFMR